MTASGATQSMVTDALGIKLAQFERRVRRLFPVEFEQHQFDPILSFTYNLGVEIWGARHRNSDSGRAQRPNNVHCDRRGAA